MILENTFQIRKSIWSDVIEVKEQIELENISYLQDLFFNIDLLKSIETSPISLTALLNGKVIGLLILDK